LLTGHLLDWPINIAKTYAGVVYEPYKGAKAEGLRGFGKGLGRGVGHVLFPQRGMTINGKRYGIRAAYDSIRKRMGAGTLSFILAAHFSQGFEEANVATEEERLDVLRRWHELAPDLKREHSGTSTASSATLTSASSTSTSTTISEMNTRSARES
jgi:hypothetical protein